jgi:hypothetical protein
VWLKENASVGRIRGVRNDHTRKRWVKMLENRRLRKGFAKCAESVRSLLGPAPWVREALCSLLPLPILVNSGFAVLDEIVQRPRDRGVPPDEPSVEIGKPKKDLDISVATWLGPLADGAHALRIHNDASGLDDESKKLDRLLIELAFGWLCVELLFH